MEDLNLKTIDEYIEYILFEDLKLSRSILRGDKETMKKACGRVNKIIDNSKVEKKHNYNRRIILFNSMTGKAFLEFIIVYKDYYRRYISIPIYADKNYYETCRGILPPINDIDKIEVDRKMFCRILYYLIHNGAVKSYHQETEYIL